MNIGEAAASSGVSAKMIRHYEGIGLIPKPLRSGAGYRHYSEADLHALRFIRQARDLGFSIDEIRRLLSLWHDRGRTSAEVKALASEHLKDLEEKIAALEAMRRTLKHLADRCHGDQRPECPIIDGLSSGTGPTQPSTIRVSKFKPTRH